MERTPDGARIAQLRAHLQAMMAMDAHMLATLSEEQYVGRRRELRLGETIDRLTEELAVERWRLAQWCPQSLPEVLERLELLREAVEPDGLEATLIRSTIEGVRELISPRLDWRHREKRVA